MTQNSKCTHISTLNFNEFTVLCIIKVVSLDLFLEIFFCQNHFKRLLLEYVSGIYR